MNIKQRPEKLEKQQLLKNKDDLHIALFGLVAPHIEVTAYMCEGKIINRNPGETLEALQQRASDAVDWPVGTSLKSFDMVAL